MNTKTLTLNPRAKQYGLLALMVLLSTQFTACGKGQTGGDPAAIGVSPQDPAVQPAEDAADMGDATVPVEGNQLVEVAKVGLTVKILAEKSVTASQSQKLKQAVSALNQVINSQELKDQILNFTYAGKKQFYQNNGLTNAQVYAALIGGAEKYPKQTTANNVADIMVATYFPPWWKRTSAVAFTTSTDPYINLYNSYFNSGSVADIANTVFHEWTHKLGFTHDFNATAARPYTVPYGVGNLIRAAVNKYVGN